MLKGLTIKNLTVFSEAQIDFSPKLNVVVGMNGTGKSHLLKVAYSLSAVLAEGRRKFKGEAPSKKYLQMAIAEKLVGVFRPENLGRLTRRRQGRARCDISLRFTNSSCDLSCGFASNSKTEVSVEKAPLSWSDTEPLFFPTRELMSLYPNFVSTYERHYLEFEETWRDTCLLLGTPLMKGPRNAFMRGILDPLEKGMSGKLIVSDGRFYIQKKDGKMEIHLVAEGHRKLAMVAHLVASGGLRKNSCLFWDEPEANLNPRLVKLIVKTTLNLCKYGVQVFMATHDLFLLRELALQKNAYKKLPVRFIGLHGEESGVVVEQGDSIDDIEHLVSLDENVDQSNRYLSEDWQEES
ncbi:MAG: ATP-binding protein [Dethiosulfovibrio peptidovorans]|nr:MAG: ATP-binding protein [Dethiosulfovibrio peptidovorans]